MRAKFLILAAMLLAAMSLSGCSLMPAEDEIRLAPVIHDYQAQDYELAVVERGDLVEQVKLTCRYEPVQTASLSFELEGEYIDKMLVQAGDTVQKGQLLGQLQLGDLEERIQSVKSSIDELELRIAHQAEVHGLNVRRIEIEGADLTPEELREAQSALEEDYALEVKTLEDQLKVQQLTLESLEADLASRQVRATFDGTVTYVRPFEDGDASEFGLSVVKVADSAMSLFRAETEHWERFHPGDEYEITVKSNPYTLVVADENELGIAVKEKTAGKREDVYFVLKDSETMFEDGDTGTLILVLNYRPDALYIPKKALVEAGEKTIVYYQREDGMRSYKEIETGIIADKKVEVVSGLVEGESIIVE